MSGDYPLFCVDDSSNDECPFDGPYTSHEAAAQNVKTKAQVVRACRRVKPSDIRFDPAELLTELAECSHPFDAIVDALDEAVGAGMLPADAWCSWDAGVVHGADGADTDTLPTAETFAEWIDTHLTVNAYICEGDE